MKVGNVAFLGDCASDANAVPAAAQLLKCIVEGHFGRTAKFVQSVWVRTPLNDTSVWEGVVYVFDVGERPDHDRAYAWSLPKSNGKRRYFTVLHEGGVHCPKEAVRAAL